MSYVTVAEADTYFANRFDSGDWDSDPLSLSTASQYVDQLNLVEEAIVETIAVQAIKDAVCEIALCLIQGIDIEKETELLRVSSDAFASVKTTYDRSTLPPHIVAGIPSAVAWKMLRPYLKDGLSAAFDRVN